MIPAPDNMALSPAVSPSAGVPGACCDAGIHRASCLQAKLGSPPVSPLGVVPKMKEQKINPSGGKH